MNFGKKFKVETNLNGTKSKVFFAFFFYWKQTKNYILNLIYDSSTAPFVPHLSSNADHSPFVCH